MRSKYRVPRDTFETCPELLRQAGYYVTNNSKTDYNTSSIDKDEIWNAHAAGETDPLQSAWRMPNERL